MNEHAQLNNNLSLSRRDKSNTQPDHCTTWKQNKTCTEMMVNFKLGRNTIRKILFSQ